MSNSMAFNSTFNEMVPSPSSSATTTRSARLRSLFSSRRNCFHCCSYVQSNAMPSTSTARAFKEIGSSSPATLPSKQIEPEIEDTKTFEGITTSPSDTYDFEQIEQSISTFEEIEPQNEDTNAFEGITSYASEHIEPSTFTFEQIEAKKEHSNAFEGIIPSASSSNKPTMPHRKLPYDVFINHRGPDVKHTIAATLYKTLTGMGLRVFLDKEELDLGDSLPAAIEEAIRGASIHIAIFSQNYAQSPWCLAELSFMLKTGTQIVPVFYHVETDVVRYAKGVYAQAFSRHEEKGRYTSKLLGEWKNALEIVSYNFGDIVLNEDDEGRLLKSIVNRILKEIKYVPFEVAKHPVGLDAAVEEFERTTIESAESHKTVQIVGIWGMGGSGKTTLAKQIYNNKYQIMDKSSFLLDVRDAASRSELHKKQVKLLEDLGLQGVSIENIEEGKRILISRLQSIRVLIILDDVDNVDQLDALVPTRDSLGSGSLIVVTSRDLQVLRSWGISSIYKMKTLSPTHAKQLFCWHAFLQSSPHQGFEILVENFINVSDGLPLSLKVFGAHLYGICDKNYWETQLHKISRILPKDIKERLKISYDALDDEEKQVFLDIACFFIGEGKTSVIAAWDGSGWNGLHSWEQLMNKCLIETNDGYIRMHDHLRDLGRAIAIEQSPYRLWSPQQVINVDNAGQAIALRGIMYRTNGSVSHGKLVVNTNRGSYTLEPSSLELKMLHVQRNCYDQVIGELSRELVWLRWDRIEHSNLQSLKSLKNMRVLRLSGWGVTGKHCLKELWKTDENAPVQLRELVIDGCSEFRRFPKSVGSLKHLKTIILRYSSKLRSLPEEFGLLQSLEDLNLTETQLSSLPNTFGDLRNLRHLDLSNNWNLERLPVSFKELRFLQHLNLKGCSKLTFESDILENMMKLQYFNIWRCDQLEELPRHIINQPSLIELDCVMNGLMEFPVNIGQLRKLQTIRIGGELLTSLPTSMGDLFSLTSLRIFSCAKLRCLPDSLGRLNLLNDLFIHECPRMKSLPDSLGCLNLLTHLGIYGLGVQSLPKSIGQLVNLQTLTIIRCPISELDLGVGLFISLKYITLQETEVSKISISKDSCPVLMYLSLHNNTNLTQIGVLPNSLNLNCLGLQSLPKSVGQLGNLQTLDIRRCPISQLDLGVGLFSSLQNITLQGTEVSKISISEDSCPVLMSLSLSNNTNLTHIEVLPNSLDIISLCDNKHATHIEFLPNSLKKIHLEGNPKLEALPSFAQSTFLRDFELKGCNRVKKIHGLEHCTALESLIAHTCWEETRIESLERMERLRKLHVKAESRSVVEGCIQSMKKWPREDMIVCAPAGPDAAFSLVKSIVCTNLCVVDSFTKRKIKSNPSLKWPDSTGGCILLCYVVNCESPEISLRLVRVHADIPDKNKTHFADYERMELGKKSKWVWTGLFTQHSFIHRHFSFHAPSRVEMSVGGKEGEVSGVFVTGEEERVKEAFSNLWASLRNS